MIRYELTPNAEGRVDYLMRAGADMVRGSMPQETAALLIANELVIFNEGERFPICVNDEFFFPGTMIDTDAKPVEKKTSRKRRKDEEA